MKYRKKPVAIEAFKYDGDLKDSDGKYYVPDWAVIAFENGIMHYVSDDGEKTPIELYIDTLEGTHHVSVGDYVIRGVKGELYPCKPDIFEQTYEACEERCSMAEMTALEYFKEKERMTKKCSISCTDCPLFKENNTTGLRCGDLQGVHPEIAVSIVEKWAEEHPKKTILQDFLEKHPNALLDMDGTPRICLKELGYPPDGYSKGCECDCVPCWNRCMETEE